MSGSRRDAGLVRAVGQWGLAATLVSGIVGAGIFAVPGELAACMGAWAPLAFVACAVMIGAVAICFAEGGSRIPTSGGTYGYVEAAFGPLTGYVAGTLLWLGDVLACGGVAAALADAMVSVLPGTVRAPVHAAVIVVVIGGIALINIGGVERGARLVGLATLMKLVPLVVFVAAGAWAVHWANFAMTAEPSTQGLGRAMILALFVLTGMEGPLSASGEVQRPARTIPRALAMTLVSVLVLYVGIQIVAQGILGPALAHSASPLPDAMARVSPALRALLLAGAAVSMFGWISSDVLATPRLLFAFARDGMLPRALGRVHPRTHAPYVAIVCYAGVAMALALTGTFAELAVLATLASSTLYIAGCAGAWKLARDGVAEAGEPLNFKWLTAAAAVGILGMVATIALASRAELIGLLTAVGASTAVYLVQTRIWKVKKTAEAAAG